MIYARILADASDDGGQGESIGMIRNIAKRKFFKVFPFNDTGSDRTVVGYK